MLATKEVSKDLLEKIYNETIVYDIETSSQDKTGWIDIRDDFEKYVENAKVKWIGLYIPRTKEKFILNMNNNNDYQLCVSLFQDAKTLVGWNNNNFDDPIVKNNLLLPDRKYQYKLDLMKLLACKDKKEGFKWRSKLMGHECKSAGLGFVAKKFGLKVHKGDIDYDIFKKDTWTPEEEEEIKFYVNLDIEMTAQLFEIYFNFWKYATMFLGEKNIANLSWMKSSLATVVYKSYCDLLEFDEAYGDFEENDEVSDGGGRAIIPKYTEAHGVWYIDFASLYPHIYAMFNLMSETTNPMKGLSLFGPFHTTGLYDNKNFHPISKDLMTKIQMRKSLQKINKNIDDDGLITVDIPENVSHIITEKQTTAEIRDMISGLIYMLKIFCNSFYGANRSDNFVNIHTENSGSDCCYLGRQIHKFVEEFFKRKGFEAVGGFTDSLFIKHKGGQEFTQEQIEELCAESVSMINKFVPFPQETFTLEVECYMDYVLYSRDFKNDVVKKNNYLYVTTDKKGNRKMKIVGFPIMKDSSTKYSRHIMNTYLKDSIVNDLNGKFDKNHLIKLINQDIEEHLDGMFVNYNVKPEKRYKDEGNLNRNISLKFFGGKSGSIKLLKNKSVGQVGASWKYCTKEELKKVQISDVCLDKVYKELQCFCDKKLNKIEESYAMF
jgi:DNA polymerase elongation subunit (family B)